MNAQHVCWLENVLAKLPHAPHEVVFQQSTVRVLHVHVDPHEPNAVGKGVRVAVTVSVKVFVDGPAHPDAGESNAAAATAAHATRYLVRPTAVGMLTSARRS